MHSAQRLSRAKELRGPRGLSLGERNSPPAFEARSKNIPDHQRLPLHLRERLHALFIVGLGQRTIALLEGQVAHAHNTCAISTLSPTSCASARASSKRAGAFASSSSAIIS